MQVPFAVQEPEREGMPITFRANVAPARSRTTANNAILFIVILGSFSTLPYKTAYSLLLLFINHCADARNQAHG